MNNTGSLSRLDGVLPVLRPTRLGALAVAVAGLLALPVLVVLSNVFTPTHDTWSHLASTVLPDYIGNTLLLMAGVAVGVMVGGISTAWLTVMCRFPGRKVF